MSGPVGNNPYRASGVIAAAAGGGGITWCTTAKTGAFCAAAGSGYLVNTTSTAFTATLPASPDEGDQVSFVDFAGTFDSNALTLGRNSLKIKGACADASLSAERGAITIVYTGTTQGWIQVNQGNDATMAQPEYVTATGGTPSTGSIVCTNYKVHTFTGTGPLCVSAAGNAAGSTSIDYLVIAGGGGGGHGASGNHSNGAGGAGGYRESAGTASGCYTVSPLGTGVSALTAAVTDYTITIGGGGAGAASRPANSTPGVDTVFSTITSDGGGGSGKGAAPRDGLTGGSGGGGSSCSSGAGGAGNTPPTSPPQGNPGGAGQDGPTPGMASGGGGGATGAGTNRNTPGGIGGNGGAGGTSCITASPVGRGGGGAGGSNGTGGTATDGGGTVPSMAGTANTGGGGASASSTTPATTGGTGGSGVVIVRYKFQ